MANSLSSRISLSFSCRNLPKLDIGSNTDPMIAVFSKHLHKAGSDWIEIGRTELIKDNQNPDFTTSIELDFFFEEVQPLRIVCVDIDNPKSVNLTRQDTVGSVETRLASVITAPAKELTLPLKHDNVSRGVVTIRAEEIVESKQTLQLHLAAEKLDKKDFFGKSDPYLKISRARENGAWEAVFTTEVIKQDINPVWKRFSIPLTKLCNSNIDRPILIECFDWDSDGTSDFIGSVQTTARALASDVRAFQLISKKQSAAGMLKILEVNIVVENSFIDYVIGGCDISLITAIDFTGSNGDPHDPQSLHHLRPDQPNQYQRAIATVGSTLAPYDTDGIIPTFGFGAKWNGQLSHCHPLADAGCRGVEHVLQTYQDTVKNVALYGPTIFREVIHLAAQQAQGCSQQRQQYTILLILTDGVITDMEATLDELIAASALPLSVVIVGVGNADFTDMGRLDSDDKLLRHGGRQAQRDIAQFVPFRDFLSQPTEALAKATLAEIPSQFMTWMKAHNIVPNPPRVQQAPPVQSVPPQPNPQQ